MESRFKYLKDMTEKLISQRCPSTKLKRAEIHEQLEKVLKLVEEGEYDLVKETIQKIAEEFCESGIENGG